MGTTNTKHKRNKPRKRLKRPINKRKMNQSMRLSTNKRRKNIKILSNIKKKSNIPIMKPKSTQRKLKKIILKRINPKKNRITKLLILFKRLISCWTKIKATKASLMPKRKRRQLRTKLLTNN